MIGTVTYMESGTYVLNTITVDGCDSIATLNLTINNSSSSSEDVTACDFYLWNEEFYRSGTYTFESTNDAGCTHVATLTLTINNSSTSQESATTCDSYDWNGTTYTESGYVHIWSLQMMLMYTCCYININY